MARTIDNTQDIIDSRDVIARIEELESERQDLADAISDAEAHVAETDDNESAQAQAHDAIEEAKAALVEWDDENGAELKALQDLADDAEGYCPDWKYGAALIRDSYFQEYAQELAEDIGAIDKAASWPNTCIDWKQAARELQQDYTSVEFDGVTYWVR